MESSLVIHWPTSKASDIVNPTGRGLPWIWPVAHPVAYSASILIRFVLDSGERSDNVSPVTPITDSSPRILRAMQWHFGHHHDWQELHSPSLRPSSTHVICTMHDAVGWMLAFDCPVTDNIVRVCSKWTCFIILQTVAETRWRLQWLEDLKQPINPILNIFALSSRFVTPPHSLPFRHGEWWESEPLLATRHRRSSESVTAAPPITAQHARSAVWRSCSFRTNLSKFRIPTLMRDMIAFLHAHYLWDQ